MDKVVKTLVAVGGAAASYLWGGWSALLGTLLTFIIIDYVTGIIASAIEGKLSSRTGMIGIAKKVSIFVMVAVAHHVDQALGQAHLLRDATIFFYLANELLSILENMGRMGTPIPPIVQKAVMILRDKGGAANEDGRSSRDA